MIIETKEIVAMRGRDPQNPSDRTAGNKNLEQRLEPNSEGICNTITTVQKDNLVIEKLGFIEKGTGEHQSNLVYSPDGLAPCVMAGFGVKMQPTMTVEVRQATKKGSVELEIGGGGRHVIYGQQNTKRKSNRKRECVSHSDNGEYP